MAFTVDSAKDFLVSKITAQAAQDEVSLDEVEQRMFLFSEVSGGSDSEKQEAFDAKYDEEAYESKLARLLRRAYAHDKRSEHGKDEWREALDALKHEEFYGLVMVDQAGIPRSRAALWAALGGAELRLLPFEIVEVAVIALGFLIVFRPSVLGLYLRDPVRWLAYPLFAWLAWYIGRVFSRMQMSKVIRRSRSTKI